MLCCFSFPLEIRRSFLWVQHDTACYFCEPWAFSVQQFPCKHGCSASSGPAAAGKARRADTEALGPSSWATLLTSHPSPGHEEGTSHQLRALGYILEDGYKVAEMEKPLGRMRGGVGHSMNALVLTCALLTKTQVCEYYLHSDLLVHWPNLYWIMLRFLHSWSELIFAICMCFDSALAYFAFWRQADNTRTHSFLTRIYQLIPEGKSSGWKRCSHTEIWKNYIW